MQMPLSFFPFAFWKCKQMFVLIHISVEGTKSKDLDLLLYQSLIHWYFQLTASQGSTSWERGQLPWWFGTALNLELFLRILTSMGIGFIPPGAIVA